MKLPLTSWAQHCALSNYHFFLQTFDSIKMLFRCCLLKFITADPALGRIEISSLPDQALMEMFLEGMIDLHKKEFRDKSGDLNDICEWPGIECVDGRVKRILL